MKQSNILKYLVLLFLIGRTACSIAQSLSASINRNPVAVGEQFQVTFSLNAAGSGFQGPSFGDFFLLSGPNMSNSMQIINNSISQSQTFTYYLQAKSEGAFKIGSASITCNGKKLESPPFSITVVKGTGGQQQGKQGETQESGVSSQDVFIRASADKSTVYQGEGILATYKLYTRIQLVNYAINKAPGFNGFWSQDIKIPAQPAAKREVLNGVAYNSYEIKKVILYPQKSGSLIIDAMEGEVIARIQSKQRGNSNNPFDMFNDPFFNDPFFGRGVRDVKVGLKSDPVKVTVRELPPNAPPSFNGTVGKFTFEAKLDREETKANEPVTLKIKISGKGNLSLIDPPKIEFPPDVESYDPKVGDNFATSPAGTSGNKTFEYLLIPRHEGSYEIAPVEFSYFDLDKKSYVAFASPSFKLKVGKGSGENVAAVTGATKAEVQLLGKDIRFIKTNVPAFIQAGKFFLGSVFFWPLAILPFIIFILFAMLKRKREKENADITFIKSRKATSMAKKRLSTAQKLLKENKNEQFFDEVSRALWGYVSDKLGIPQSDLSRESIIEKLKVKMVSEDSIKKLGQTLDYCEFARFASASAGVSNQTIYNEAVTVISKIEEEIK